MIYIIYIISIVLLIGSVALHPNTLNLISSAAAGLMFLVGLVLMVAAMGRAYQALMGNTK